MQFVRLCHNDSPWIRLVFRGRKVFCFIKGFKASARQLQNPGALLLKFPQYHGDTAGLRKQAPALFLSVTKRSSFRQLDPAV